MEYEAAPTVTTQPGPAEAALTGGRLGPVAEEAGGSFTEVLQGRPGGGGPEAQHGQVPPDAGHLGPGAGAAAGGGTPGAAPGGGDSVRRKISSGLQAVGRGLTGGISKVGRSVLRAMPY